MNTTHTPFRHFKLIILIKLIICCMTPNAFATGMSSATDACIIPTERSLSQDETAWRLFVAINCFNEVKNKKKSLTWETWQTQACLQFPEDCKKSGRLQGSLLKQAKGKVKLPRRTHGCNPMTTVSPANPTLNSFVPKNLSSKPVFCEEVVINPAEQKYAEKNGLLTNYGQVAFLANGGIVSTPSDSIEVKADWVPISSYKGRPFDCNKPHNKIYTEIIDGQCYALTGMHISSKLYPNWLWSTFEPQFAATNPNRCNPDLYNSCNDTWGSNPEQSTGQDTDASQNLKTLFNSAGSNLHPAFRNYRLTGSQTTFDQPVATLANLGSSFVEFNAGVPVHEASCITCHHNAQRQPYLNPVGTPLGGPFPGAANTGKPTPPVPFKPLDFSWFLAFGVPQGNQCQDFNAGPYLTTRKKNENTCTNVCNNLQGFSNKKFHKSRQGDGLVCGCCAVKP